MEPESETEFTNRIESAIKIADELLKETPEKGKVINSESKENLDPRYFIFRRRSPYQKSTRSHQKTIITIFIIIYVWIILRSILKSSIFNKIVSVLLSPWTRVRCRQLRSPLNHIFSAGVHWPAWSSLLNGCPWLFLL